MNTIVLDLRVWQGECSFLVAYVIALQDICLHANMKLKINSFQDECQMQHANNTCDNKFFGDMSGMNSMSTRLARLLTSHKLIFGFLPMAVA